MQYKEMIEGLQIFAKYDEKGLDAFLEADHDVIFGPGYVRGESNPEALDRWGDPIDIDVRFSLEDCRRLNQLGWTMSQEFDCWAHSC